MDIINGRDIIAQHDLYFDTADKANASLYICTPPQHRELADRIIAELREQGLWSQQDNAVAVVTEEQKPAYQEQLTFIGALKLASEYNGCMVAAYNHPKFPMHSARWNAWREALAG